MSGAITGFRGAFRFLSNFYEAEIEYDGVVYQAVEYAYQAAKTFDPEEREEIRVAPTCGKAKRLGRHVTIRPDWETIKLGIMEDLVRQKFVRHKELSQGLLATGDAELIEGNTWGDREWGMVQVNGSWVGKNLLGRILMKVREELRSVSRETV